MKRPYGSLAALLVLSSVAMFACNGTTSAGRAARRGHSGCRRLRLRQVPGERVGTKDENCTIGANEVGSNGAGDDYAIHVHAWRAQFRTSRRTS